MHSHKPENHNSILPYFVANDVIQLIEFIQRVFKATIKHQFIMRQKTALFHI